ncbi:hypothetical protein J6590_016347 [Homalodisca vitripennis]|nr:hypothetical protein J6590_016347 [Homalodisca vitripennis]
MQLLLRLPSTARRTMMDAVFLFKLLNCPDILHQINFHVTRAALGQTYQYCSIIPGFMKTGHEILICSTNDFFGFSKYLLPSRTVARGVKKVHIQDIGNSELDITEAEAVLRHRNTTVFVDITHLVLEVFETLEFDISEAEACAEPESSHFITYVIPWAKVNDDCRAALNIITMRYRAQSDDVGPEGPANEIHYTCLPQPLLICSFHELIAAAGRPQSRAFEVVIGLEHPDGQVTESDFQLYHDRRSTIKRDGTGEVGYCIDSEVTNIVDRNQVFKRRRPEQVLSPVADSSGISDVSRERARVPAGYAINLLTLQTSLSSWVAFKGTRQMGACSAL